MLQNLPKPIARAPLHASVDPTLPRHIGLVNDYVRIPYANGSSFASQFLYRELGRRGHALTVIGPREPDAPEGELPPSRVCLSSLPMRNHPGLFVPFPDAAGLRAVERLELDAIVAQTGSGLMALASWLRTKRGVPALIVNTVHLPSVYDAVLPPSLHENPIVQGFCRDGLVPWVLSHTVRVYNRADGLVVLSRGLKSFWQAQGVTVPIHVIPRPVDPSIFDGPGEDDPFDPRAARGGRLLCVCRHTREKSVARLIELFATEVAPRRPDATLTLVGDGPDHDAFRTLAERCGVEDRTFFPGEFPVTSMRSFYRHADVFVYASLSETYGQVVSEALWCGLPVVAFDDEKGVRDQVADGRCGFLVAPAPADEADARFGARVLALLGDGELRGRMARFASSEARRRCEPHRNVAAWQDALRGAREHCARSSTTPSAAAALMPLAQWGLMHTLMVGAGLLRAPATINRHRRRQPGWDLASPAPFAI